MHKGGKKRDTQEVARLSFLLWLFGGACRARQLPQMAYRATHTSPYVIRSPPQPCANYTYTPSLLVRRILSKR